MKNWRPIFWLMFVFTWVGCSREKEVVSSPFALPVVTLEIAGNKVQAEVADTPQTMASGLMHRKSMAENSGMIFVFASERQASFWMRNTHIPLDIAYLDREGRVKEIHPAQPLDEDAVVSGSTRIAYALELNQGWFANRGITPGTQVKGLPPFPPRQ